VNKVTIANHLILCLLEWVVLLKTKCVSYVVVQKLCNMYDSQLQTVFTFIRIFVVIPVDFLFAFKSVEPCANMIFATVFIIIIPTLESDFEQLPFIELVNSWASSFVHNCQ